MSSNLCNYIDYGPGEWRPLNGGPEWRMVGWS